MKQVYNPYLPLYEYVPDGEPRVFDGRVYVYGSHDLAGGKKYCLGDYVTWSAPIDDLKDWRYEGVIYRKDQDPSNADGKMELWAPDIAKGPDGRYYLYYCFSFHPEIGVAVSDSPAGPFEYYGHVKFADTIMGGKALGDPLPFDPGILADEDGRRYLYFGFSPAIDNFFAFATGPKGLNLPGGDLDTFRKAAGMKFREGNHVVELEPDMVTMKGEPKLCLPGGKIAAGTGFENHAFFEASSVRKVNGKYYCIYSSQRGHELCYAVSGKPTEGFVYGGVIVSNGDLGLRGNKHPVWTTGNNHGSIEKIGDIWYVFHHRQTHNTEDSRQGCAEKIAILPDGSIPQVEITSCGLNGGPLAARGSYPAAIACHLTGKNTPDAADYTNPVMRTLPCVYEEHRGDSERDHIQYIRQIGDGAVIGYKYFDCISVSALELCLRGSARGTLTVALDPKGNDKAGSTAISVCGGWQKVRIPISVPDGVHALYFIYSGDGELDFHSFSF